jgi:hypothetical protein
MAVYLSVKVKSNTTFARAVRSAILLPWIRKTFGDEPDYASETFLTHIIHYSDSRLIFLGVYNTRPAGRMIVQSSLGL